MKINILRPKKRPPPEKLAIGKYRISEFEGPNEEKLNINNGDRLKVPFIGLFDPVVEQCRCGPMWGPNPTDFDSILVQAMVDDDQGKAVNLPRFVDNKVKDIISVTREDSFSFPVLSTDLYSSLGLVEDNRTPIHTRAGSEVEEVFEAEMMLAECNEIVLVEDEGSAVVTLEELLRLEASGVEKVKGQKYGFWWKIGFFLKCCVFPKAPC